ncbi:hypothetical protein Cgig2_022093 [Carnegiea gigantea]|uniref:Uncharacterized protein n=1 Tax=Carnegiea gigantea TaxID=171969 RepID=A0A9Q1KSW2_9CARY|nr:hypothetical protein Cgig2_022093 [Carnegiea gigantea]
MLDFIHFRALLLLHPHCPDKWYRFDDQRSLGSKATPLSQDGNISIYTRKAQSGFSDFFDKWEPFLGKRSKAPPNSVLDGLDLPCTSSIWKSALHGCDGCKKEGYSLQAGSGSQSKLGCLHSVSEAKYLIPLDHLKVVDKNAAAKKSMDKAKNDVRGKRLPDTSPSQCQAAGGSH